MGVNDGVIQIELADGHEPTGEIIKKLRAELARAFFGVPTQIDVQLQGQDGEGNKEIAALLQQKLANDSGPGRRACSAGTERAGNVLHNRPHARAGTRAEHAGGRQQPQHQPVFVGASLAQFLDRPRTGIPYFMAVQTPGYRLTNKNQLDNTVLASSTGVNGTPIRSRLGNIATAKRVAVQSLFNQSNIQPVYDVYAE
jgi:hypothetical protein